MHTLENEFLKVKINSIGAELHSIYNKKNTTEYLWQGDPDIWASRAPVLFPIIGGLKEGTYAYKGQSYELPKHGFIRYNEDLVVDQPAETKVTFSLQDSAETLKIYPFHFRFEVTYELIENQLKVSHQITNRGNTTMYFSVGGHPAFNCPLYEDEVYTDYYIQLQNGTGAKSHVLNKEGLISNQTIAIFEDDKIKLTPNLFDNDALIFKQINAGKATLSHNNKGPILSVDFKDFPDLGIWAKPNAPYVCIEPWLGYADVENTNQNLEEKEGIQQLPAKEIHHSSYTITVY
ncbi:aldose 1-epimerase family protein [Aquimarina brevivitae]|uniref:Galactose mutarotase-like enzyme n=1 Tax=Aquimarina brevivitae TaxID=323412 RepID=A0A4Q7PG59_9FLAO|nr:aldose 1-epimerase family protein [Aquimarina brevivitae]RZS99481.1 galactose mutarotase-like enzyme [Aquimarina brevivitae]